MRSSFARSLFTALLTLAVLVGLARAVAIRWWRVPDDDPWLQASIAPTLQGGDWVLLWRLTAPHLGDLVLCPEPNHPTRPVIARIAAQGGQRIEIEGGQVRLNGHAASAEQSCLDDKFTVVDPQTRLPLEQTCTLEKMGGGIHQRGDVKGQPSEPVTATLENDRVFLVSDNRQLPYDSRDFGSVEEASCKETVFFRLVGAKGFSDVTHRLTFIR